MEETLQVTLVANAGLLLRYQGVTLLLDGIYGREGHPFSNLAPDVWERMLHGGPPFEKIDYLLFSHAHPDHFSPEMTMEFLEHRRVKGVFLPESHSAAESGLVEYLRAARLPSVLLSERTDRAEYRIEPEISVRAFSTRHLDKKFQNIRHFCYLVSFGGKRVLFTADVDYTQETFDDIRDLPLRAVFVNPLFFGVLRRGNFFHGELNTQSVCVYHVPFSGEDPMRMRPVLARDLVEWPRERPESFVLCDAFQHIDL
jgi:L-ascorbate metabolism protein UlaG (beta-lactamase superfamily)